MICVKIHLVSLILNFNNIPCLLKGRYPPTQWLKPNIQEYPLIPSFFLISDLLMSLVYHFQINLISSTACLFLCFFKLCHTCISDLLMSLVYHFQINLISSTAYLFLCFFKLCHTCNCLLYSLLLFPSHPQNMTSVKIKNFFCLFLQNQHHTWYMVVAIYTDVFNE